MRTSARIASTSPIDVVPSARPAPQPSSTLPPVPPPHRSACHVRICRYGRVTLTSYQRNPKLSTGHSSPLGQQAGRRRALACDPHVPAINREAALGEELNRRRIELVLEREDPAGERL